MSQKSARRCLIITTVVFGLAGVLGLLPALTSVFLFDAPGSEKNPATIVLFFSALTLPIACLISIVLSWVFYARERFRSACYISFLPVVNLLCGAAALIWLELFNAGQFS
jgi:O-antigen/teichoic acid export membrane protein